MVKMRQDPLLYIEATTLIFQRAELHPEIFINVECSFHGSATAYSGSTAELPS